MSEPEREECEKYLLDLKDSLGRLLRAGKDKETNLVEQLTLLNYSDQIDKIDRLLKELRP